MIARIVGQPLVNRSPLVVLVTAVVGLMFPAGAMAAIGRVTPLVAGPRGAIQRLFGAV
jgi:hypothetical protein